MKKVFALLFAASCTFIACDNRDESGTTDTHNSDMSKNETDSTRGDKPGNTTSMANTPPSQASIDFAMKAASGGMMEVQLGQMAQQKAKGQRVKDFGSMMVTDHGSANDELKMLAASNNVTLPSALLPEHQKHIDMMSKITGDVFDKHYMSMMVNDHKKDISEFQKQAGSATNDVFKSFAAKTLPVLQKHLASAQAINSRK